MRYEILDEVQAPETGLQSSQEGWGSYGLRTGARTAARIGESLLGTPGDVVNAGLALTNYGIGKVTGSQSPLPSSLPIGSDAIREYGTKQLTGDYLEPQSGGEALFDELAGLGTVLFNPSKALAGAGALGKVASIGKESAKALGKAAAGKTVRSVVEGITGSPLFGIAGQMVAIGLANTAGGRKAVQGLQKNEYDTGFKAIPDNKKFDFRPELNSIEKNILSVARKGDASSKKFILERGDALSALFKNSKGKRVLPEVRDIVKLKQDWNDLRKYAHPKEQMILDRMVGTLKEGIDRYGKTNTKFWDPYKRGEELTKALNARYSIDGLLSKYPQLNDGLKSPLTKALFGLGAGGASLLSPFKILKGGTIGAAVYGASELSKLAHLYLKSPTARQYYNELVKASATQNVLAASKAIKGLDASADEFLKKHPEFMDEPEGRYELID